MNVQISIAQVDEVDAKAAWDLLSETDGAVLVDVRSRPEWSFSGMADLSAIDRDVVTVEWQTWPNMAPNLGFLADLETQLGDRTPPRMFFMCRMGGRAFAAAREVARQMHDRGVNLHITNIIGGFEGDQNADGQRGKINGWKAEGLPWRQN